MSDKIKLAKMAVRIVTTVGVSKVVHDIIQNNTTVETGADSAKVWVGSYILGSMITEKARENTSQKFDDIVALWQDHKTNGELADEATEKSDR